MPFSATIKKLGKGPVDDAPVSEIHTHPLIPSQLQTIQQHLRCQTKSANKHKDNAISTQNRTLQIAVVIAMPSPRKCKHESTREGLTNTSTHYEPRDAHLCEYSLGVMEMPWHPEEG